MSENFKKHMKRMETYLPKGIVKHNHNYCKKYLLIVTNKNEHASGAGYNSKEYYYVLKCDQCDSFIPDSIEGNYNHHIYYEKDIDFNMPKIEANTLDKCPHYSFSKLIDVVVDK